MRLAIWAGLLGLLITVSPSPADTDTSGNFYARIRANDAPIGGRFTIYAYMLDSLDTAITMPGPGRVLALHFRESNGRNAFVIPGDLDVRGSHKQQWKGGFLPVGQRRLAGFLPKDDSRWALWWIPSGTDTLIWDSPDNLTFHYGFGKSIFVPLGPKDVKSTLTALPWEEIHAAKLEADRPTSQLAFPPNPAAFDRRPVIKERKTPVYPRSSRQRIRPVVDHELDVQAREKRGGEGGR
jgi:hypothetical protein